MTKTVNWISLLACRVSLGSDDRANNEPASSVMIATALFFLFLALVVRPRPIFGFRPFVRSWSIIVCCGRSVYRSGLGSAAGHAATEVTCAPNGIRTYGGRRKRQTHCAFFPQ